MRYSHSWQCQPEHPDFVAAWPGLLRDARRIIQHVRMCGVVVAGPTGRRDAVLDLQYGIAFNGDATTDLDGDPFHLTAPPTRAVAGVPGTRPVVAASGSGCRRLPGAGA